MENPYVTMGQFERYLEQELNRSVELKTPINPFRQVGKTTALIMYAKGHHLTAIVFTEDLACKFRREFDYPFIYSMVASVDKLYRDNAPSEVLVDEIPQSYLETLYKKLPTTYKIIGGWR
jgi:hypothetical protein